MQASSPSLSRPSWGAAGGRVLSGSVFRDWVRAWGGAGGLVSVKNEGRGKTHPAVAICSAISDTAAVPCLLHTHACLLTYTHARMRARVHTCTVQAHANTPMLAHLLNGTDRQTQHTHPTTHMQVDPSPTTGARHSIPPFYHSAAAARHSVLDASKPPSTILEPPVSV